MKYIKEKICKKEINKIKELENKADELEKLYNKEKLRYENLKQVFNGLEDRFDKLEASRISEKEQYLKDREEFINKSWEKLQEAWDELFFEKSKERKRIEDSRTPLTQILNEYDAGMGSFYPSEKDSFIQKLFSLFDEMQKQIDQQDELKERLATQTANNIILTEKLNEVKNERN